MKKHAASRKSRRVVRQGPASLGAAAALDSKRFQGTKPLNANPVRFKPGRNKRSFTHSKTPMAPISKGHGLKAVGAHAAAGGAALMSGERGPLNQCD